MPFELTHSQKNLMASRDSAYTFFERDRFQKLDATGKPLPDSADTWACVKDKVNGEVWEAKTDGKWRNKLHTYVINGSAGQCGTEGCLADDYVKRVNASALCGLTNWQVPSRGELLRLVYFEHPEGEPTVDIRYFINTQKGRYLTSTEFKYGAGRMITVDFENGYDKSHKGDEPAYLRLVAR